MRKPTQEEIAILAAALTLADAIKEFGHGSAQVAEARELLEKFALIYRETRSKKLGQTS